MWWSRVRSSGDPSCTVSEEAKEAAAETGEQVRNLKRRQSAEEGRRKLKDSKGGRGERKTKLRHSQEKKICRKMVWENQKKKDMVIYQFIWAINRCSFLETCFTSSAFKRLQPSVYNIQHNSNEQIHIDTLAENIKVYATAYIPERTADYVGAIDQIRPLSNRSNSRSCFLLRWRTKRRTNSGAPINTSIYNMKITCEVKLLEKQTKNLPTVSCSSTNVNFWVRKNASQ